jgi:predicted ferric reductase
LGLTIRIPYLRKYFAPLYALEGHCFIALQATIFALLHGTILMLDKFMKFTLTDVFVPFSSHFESGFVALGTLGFYLMVMLTITSYARKYLSQKLWRILHFTNMGLYIIVVIHALYLGTDMKIEIIRNIFIGLNVLLVILILTNLAMRMKETIERKKRMADYAIEQEEIQQNENIQ